MNRMRVRLHNARHGGPPSDPIIQHSTLSATDSAHTHICTAHPCTDAAGSDLRSEIGSGARIRTVNLAVNSRLLYR